MTIQNLDDELANFERKPAQRQFLANVLRLHEEHGIRFHLLIKPRQIGFTTDIQGYMNWKAWRQPLRAGVMAHDADTTAKMRVMAKLYYDELPDEIKAQVVRASDNAAVTSYLPHHSQITIATAGAERAKTSNRGGKGRGGTYNFFHGSEVASWPNPSAVIAGALQGLSDDGLCIFETTAKGASGWVHDMAMNPTAAWHVHFIAWWCDARRQTALEAGEVITPDEVEERTIRLASADGYELTPEQIKWKRGKIAEFGADAFLFDQEYPETLETAFLTSGNSIFGSVVHALIPEGSIERVAEHTHIAALDWGMSNDWTVLGIMDVQSEDEMFIARWRQMQWFDLIERIVDELVKWGVTKVYPESNSMPMQIEALRNEINKRGLNISIWPINVSPKNKGTLIKGLYAAIHVQGVGFQDAPWATSEFHTFVATQSGSGQYQYSATSGAHDDAVMMRTFLCWGLSQTLK